MIQLSDEQLNDLGKEALVVIVSSLQDQLPALHSQPDHANAQLSDNNRQIELLTEQIRIMNQRFFGLNVSDVDGQISLFDPFNEAEYLNQDPSKEPEITKVIIPSYHRKKAVGKRESDLCPAPFWPDRNREIYLIPSDLRRRKPKQKVYPTIYSCF